MATKKGYTKPLDIQGPTLKAIQKVLVNFKFAEATSFGELFAQQRYMKKMEVPDTSVSTLRREAAWDDWLKNDARGTAKPALLPGNWYKARLICREALKHFRMGDISFSNGSEFIPTRGHGSIEAKLSRNEWTVTPNCWKLWVDLTYEYHGFRVAVRKRFRERVARSTGLSGKQLDNWIRSFHKESWRLLHPSLPRNSRARACWERVVSMVTTIEQGNRFSTVRKNNSVDRPICVENLCNMLVQRRIGLGLRGVIQKHFGIDLRNAAMNHRRLVSDAFHSIATIDLKNASDSVWLWLTDFMLDPKTAKLIHAARSYVTLGLDGNYHVIQKTSSMGNGFTFELMSLILLCITRVHDQAATVFGDDIIVAWDKAYAVIRDLEGVGLQVNHGKTFIHGDFRESCGANYHWREGYIESYDFEYPLTIADAALSVNKVARLAHKYGSFKRLYEVLLKVVPAALRGAAILPNAPVSSHVRQVDTWFGTGCKKRQRSDRFVTRYCQLLQLDPSRVKYFTGWFWESKLATKTDRELRPHNHWGKILAYLLSGVVVDDALVGMGKWKTRTLIEVDGRVVHLASVRKAVQAELVGTFHEPR